MSRRSSRWERLDILPTPNEPITDPTAAFGWQFDDTTVLRVPNAYVRATHGMTTVLASERKGATSSPAPAPVAGTLTTYERMLN